METAKANSSNPSTTTDSTTGPDEKQDSQCFTAAVLQVGDMGDAAKNSAKTWYQQENVKYMWVVLLGFAALVDVLGTILPGLETSNGICSSDDQCEVTNAGSTSCWQSFIAWLDRHDIPISFVFSALWFLDAFWTAYKAWINALEAREMSAGETIYDFQQLENDRFDVVEMDEDGMEHHEQFSIRSKKAFIFAIAQHFAGRTTRSVMQYIKSKVFALVKKLTKRLFSKAIFNPLKFRRQVKKVLKILRYVKYGFPLIGKLNRIRGLVTLAWKRQRQHFQAQKAKRARQLLWESKPREVREIDAAIIIQSAFRARQARKAVKAMRILKAEKEYLAVCKIQHVLKRKLREGRARLEAKRKELERLEQLKEQTMSDKQKLRMYELRHDVLNETKVLLNRKMLMRPNTKFAIYWKLFFAICLLWELAGAALQPLLYDEKSKSRNGEVGPTTVEELIAHTFVPTRIADWPQCQIDSHDGEDDTTGLRWYCEDPISSTQESIRDVLALTLIPTPVSKWSECNPISIPTKKRRFTLFRRKKTPEATEVDLNWYCEQPYSTLHEHYRNLVNWFWSEVVVLVGVAYFMDVFVTFFTGEFHPVFGVLMPKPIFARWILPGLVLQLAVNPYMKAVSHWTRSTFSWDLSECTDGTPPSSSH
ncbi:MAG: hypothetical protein SGBAC_002165 [Bacillariaceae sp.]